MQSIQKRWTAYKFWIKDIINATTITKEGAHFFEIRGKEAARTNVIATVVDKQTNADNTFSTITLDDATETIRVKTWKEDTKKLEEINIGDQVMIIGRIRVYNDEIFITPEIAKKQEPEWLLVRKKELEKAYGKPEEKARHETKEESRPQEIIEEEVIEPTETARQKILEIIEKEPEGIQIGELIKQSGLKEEEAEKAIDELLREGEVFQPRNGFLKVI